LDETASQGLPDLLAEAQASKTQVKLLIVEDSSVYARLIEDCLRPEDLDVTWVKTADAALTQVTLFQPEIVICDILLPGEHDGFWLCREIKRSHPQIQFLLISSLDSTFDKITGLETGADDYIAKPVDPLELRARFRVLKRRVQAQKPTPVVSKIPETELEQRGVRINRSTRAVAYSSQILELRRREFDILWYLMENTPRVVDRQELLEQIWADPSITLRTIDTHIQRLREKLQAAGAPVNLIETHRGTGYRFNHIS